jgi:hypothetical protein
MIKDNMKKYILILISVVGLVFLIFISAACEERRGPKAPQSKQMELDTNSQYYDQQYRVYTLEGCEYIVCGQGTTRWGSHKGNCKNPIHNEKK